MLPAALLTMLVAIGIAAVGWPGSSPPLRDPHRLAVLPIRDLTGLGGQLADAMTDSLITALGKVTTLKVMSLTSVSRTEAAIGSHSR